MPIFDLGSISLFAERAGSGQHLLFISGTGGDLRTTPSIFNAPFASSFDLLAYDQRGLGQSDIPDGPYTMADYADDAAALLGAVDWDQCMVMGVSFGGMVAQELTIRHPELVRRLLLVCTSSGGAGGASIPFTELAQLEGRARVERRIEMMDTRWNPERRVTHQAEWQMMVEGLLAHEEGGDHSPEAARGAALQLEARSHHDTWDRLPQISCPTLICAGRFDGIASPQNNERMASQIPGAELEFFEGGHMFLLQDPRAFERISAFLGQGG